MHTQTIHPYIHRKVVIADGPVDRREKTHRSRPACPPAQPFARSVGRLSLIVSWLRSSCRDRRSPEERIASFGAASYLITSLI